MSDVYRPCASVLLFRASKRSGVPFEILLLKKPRKNDAWQLPQGGQEQGEDVSQAAMRELFEEAGIAAQLIGKSSLVYQYDYPASYRAFRPDNVCGQRIRFVFALTAADVPVRVDGKEIEAFRWVAPSEAGNFIKRKKYLAIIRSLVAEGKNLIRSS
ncbi:MAG: NUDIX domain-containing protein [Candidatus Peregrinibacteria bacterium]